MIIDAPSPTNPRANSGPLTSLSSQPARCFTERNRVRQRFAHGGHQLGRERRFLHEGRPARAAGDLFRRAPHVDVDHGRADVGGHQAASDRAFGSRPKIWTEKAPMQAGPHAHLTRSTSRLQASADKNSVKVNAAPRSSSNRAKRQVGDSFHGCQEDARGNFDVGDAHVRAPV